MGASARRRGFVGYGAAPTLFCSRTSYALATDDKHQVVVDGLGEFNGLDYLAAARTADGGLIMAYLPSSRTFTVDMTKVAGKVAKAWWFNPRTGKSNAAGEFPTAGRRQKATGYPCWTMPPAIAALRDKVGRQMTLRSSAIPEVKAW